MAPPSGLVGTWARTVTADEVKKATSGSAPPVGNWRLTIAPVGWAPLDPQGIRGVFDVGYRSHAAVEMRPTIEHPPFPNPGNGGFCADTDPIFIWAVAIGGGGTTLSLHPAGHDPCGGSRRHS